MITKIHHHLFLFISLLIVAWIHSCHGARFWPLPQEVDTDGTWSVARSDAFTFTVADGSYSSTILTNAFQRYTSLLFWTPASGSSVRRPPVSVPLRGNRPASAGPHWQLSSTNDITALNVFVASPDESLNDATDESYTLNVSSASPIANLRAQSFFGALRGIETFSQLFTYNSTLNVHIVESANIYDFPRFAYRGILIDTSRHFLPVPLILEHLDTMFYNKMNVLHWHIVDDQSFPFVSEVFPNLSAMGAFSPNHVYQPSDVETILQFARDRGIRVIPEFDTPGHMQSWGKGQPDLLTKCYPFGGYGPVNPTLNSTYTFLEQFFGEVSERFRDDFIHLGGDEVSYLCWISNVDVRAFMRAHNWTLYNALENYYEQQLLGIVERTGKHYIVWQEVFNNGVELHPATVVDVWRGDDKATMSAATKAGFRVILSGGWYLDDLDIEPWHDNWVDYYLQDPTDFDGSAQQKSLVLGGSAAMWGEHVDATNFMTRVWPRASAVAERLWSAADVRDVDAAQARLDNFRCRMNHRGIDAEPIDIGFCGIEFDYVYP